MNDFLDHLHIFLILWFPFCFLVNVYFHVSGYRAKIKTKKKSPPNKPEEEFKYEIVNSLKEVGLTAYSIVKYNLNVLDKINDGHFLSILLTLIIPFPVINLVWYYEEKYSFSISEDELKELESYDDIVLYYENLKAIIDEKDNEKNKINEKINFINSQNGKR